MAGQPQNLIPNSERTPQERRERAQKMGIASGEARRQKKALREILPELLSLDISSKKTREQLKQFGIKDEELTNGTLVGVSLLKEAIKGKVPAIRLLAELMGENDVQGVAKVQPHIDVVFPDDPRAGQCK